MTIHRLVVRRSLRALLPGVLAACTTVSDTTPAADLILHNGRVYSMAWPEPTVNGVPSAQAPYDSVNGWRHDATAVVVREGRVVFVGNDSAALALKGPTTRVLDLKEHVVLPGLVDAHTHVAELGQSLDRVNLTGVATEAEAVALIAARAATTPKGEWILGYGWDEGAWANRYPDKTLLTARVPDHPVILRSLHGFAAWANERALTLAGITRNTPVPTGGEIRLDAKGEPTGLVLNRAVPLLDNAVPLPTPAQRDAQVLRALHVMAHAGYTGVHEAGVAPDVMDSFERLALRDSLPLRVYAMLSARDSSLIRQWITRGPFTSANGMLSVRAVKAYYDGALGSRGAQLLADYADQPGHRGVSGGSYGFDQRLVADIMSVGFQVGIHAIGDAGNRATLNFIDSVMRAAPKARGLRHRVEHAQVVSPPDLARFASLGVIASVQPPHAVEDKGWAETRLGANRIGGAYAWRTLRQAGAGLVFSSDLPGSDWSPFYGLHSAITRQDTSGTPPGGWYPAQRMTPEEAVRGYTVWSATAGFDETQAGVIAVGKRADLTVMDVDPFRSEGPALLKGRIMTTVSRGRVVYLRTP
ncbi:amidohydrolase [Gemmatimonas phototrophica]|uniref:amidohydrolase n=1 Tax=Gemmatimonas phototrophica TaxID=1379270 RepID=UPI0006A718A4|nr:amidohydrolase [Gemmatimonas phototrophica]